MTELVIGYDEFPPEQQQRRTRLKVAILLLLLLFLAWLSFVAFRYCTTGKPIADIAPLPPAVKPLFREPPQYIGSLDGVARPLGVAVSDFGMVYVTESAGERTIRVFNPLGTQEDPLVPPGSSVGGRTLLYVAISPLDGKVYVTDSYAHAIHVFSASGEPLERVATPFTDVVWTPGAIAFDKNANMYVTDATPGLHRVLVFDAQGALVRQFGREGTGPGEFSFPNGVDVDKKGNIYVADSGNGRVQAFDAQGTYLWSIGRGTAKGDFAMPRGLVVDDERDLLLVVDTTDQNVKAYDIAGSAPKYVYTVGTPVIGGGGFRFPNGIALDGKGRIYITDRENHRVAVWRY